DRRGLADAVRTTPPVSIRSHRRTISRQLETVVSRCLAKERHRRFASASVLADELRRCMRPRSIMPWVLLSLTTFTALGFGFWPRPEPPRPPEEQFQQDVAPLLERLARQEPVDLIQPGSSMPPNRIRFGQHMVTLAKNEEGVQVSARSEAIIEFLP